MPELTDSLGLDEAAKALTDFVGGPVASATRAIDEAVKRSFRSVESTIASAALSGRKSMSELVDSILTDFDRVAVSQFIVKPIESVVNSLAGSLVGSLVSGARATGGPVAEGAAYIVGEQGPELFVPSSNGAIVPGTQVAARPQITLNVAARDAQSFLKSETQLAAMLARALARGQRNM